MSTAPPTDDGLVHVVVCGGSPAEWQAMSGRDWRARFETVARGVGPMGTRWVTILPHHGVVLADTDARQLELALESVEKVERVERCGHRRWVWRRDDGLTVVVDPSPDGHARFAAVTEGLRMEGTPIEEATLSSALLYPVESEPDLALILGPADTIPRSLVWELAYAELVFLDIRWADLQSGHLEMAIDDFNRRHRRFGGLDS